MVLPSAAHGRSCGCAARPRSARLWPRIGRSYWLDRWLLPALAAGFGFRLRVFPRCDLLRVMRRCQALQDLFHAGQADVLQHADRAERCRQRRLSAPLPPAVTIRGVGEDSERGQVRPSSRGRMKASGPGSWSCEQPACPDRSIAGCLASPDPPGSACQADEAPVKPKSSLILASAS